MICTHFHEKEVAIFPTYFWIIWYARNKLKHEGSSSIVNLIVSHSIYLSYEYNALHHYLPSSMGNYSSVPAQRIWKPPDLGILKVSTNAAFSKSKICMGILVQNHLGYSF